MKIGIGADHNAIELKNELIHYLQQLGHDVADFTVTNAETIDYPLVAFRVAETILQGDIERGVLVCGTGLGMAIAATKVPGIRAATCHDTYSAERAVKSNNAQIITIGAKVVGVEHAKNIIASYINAEFASGDSARKVEQIMTQEKHYYEQFKSCEERR